MGERGEVGRVYLWWSRKASEDDRIRGGYETDRRVWPCPERADGIEGRENRGRRVCHRLSSGHMFLSSMDLAGGALLHGRRRREGFRGRAAPSSCSLQPPQQRPRLFPGTIICDPPRISIFFNSPAPAPSLPTPRFKIPLGLLPSISPPTHVCHISPTHLPGFSVLPPHRSPARPECLANNPHTAAPPSVSAPPRTHHTEPPSPDRPPGQRLPADHAPHSHTPRGAITARERRHVRGNPINRQRGEPFQLGSLPRTRHRRGEPVSAPPPPRQPALHFETNASNIAAGSPETSRAVTRSRGGDKCHDVRLGRGARRRIRATH